MIFMSLCDEHADRIAESYTLADTGRYGTCMLPECGRAGKVYEATSRREPYRRRAAGQNVPARDSRAKYKGKWRDF